jgi:hypothetical protein
MNVVSTPQARCLAAAARADITPPVGIYHRMWGAATHDRSTGVHRPLTATLLWLEPAGGDLSQALVIASLDHCLFDSPDIDQMRRSIAEAAGIHPDQSLIAVTHTHAAGLMSRSRADLPGGELIGPYLDRLAEQLGKLAVSARHRRQPATIVYGTGRCDLAAHRDLYDEERQRFVCGFNPQGRADDALLVAKVSAQTGQPLAIVVNYACHATTLAWQNTLISPDYLGAMREVIEHQTQAPCLFLQGASGDLGPREGFVGDGAVADRNGRRLGFAALCVLESLPPPLTRYVYAGPVLSGATIGTWEHQPLESAEVERLSHWQVERINVPLSYRPDLPAAAATQAELERCQAAESAAQTSGDEVKARDCHARCEQLTRQLWRLKSLPGGPAFPLSITLARLGDALWLFVPGEHYQSLQTALRSRFPQCPLFVATIANGWQPGYIPPADTYGKGIYQEQIAVVAAGSAEAIVAAVAARLERM